MNDSDVKQLTAGSVYRRSTWDEILSPGDYAARLYPSGIPRVAPLRRESKGHPDWVDDTSVETTTYDWDNSGYWQTISKLTTRVACTSYSCADHSLRGVESRQLAGYYSNRPLTAKEAMKREAERYKKWRMRQDRNRLRWEAKRIRKLNRLKSKYQKALRDCEDVKAKIDIVRGPYWPPWLYMSIRKRTRNRVIAAEEQRARTLANYRQKLTRFEARVAQRLEAIQELLTTRFRLNRYRPKWYDFVSRKFVCPVADLSSEMEHFLLPVNHVKWKTSAKMLNFSFQVTRGSLGSPTYSITVKGMPLFLGGHTVELGTYPARRTIQVTSPSGESTVVSDTVPWHDIDHGYRPLLPEKVDGQTSLPAYDEVKFQHALNKLLPSGVKTYVDVPYFVAQFDKVTTMLPQLRQLASQLGRDVAGLTKSIAKSAGFFDSGLRGLSAPKASLLALKAAALKSAGQHALSTLRTLSCADLYRKFSVKTTVSSLSDLKDLIDGTSPFYEAFEKLLREANTLIRRSSTFDESATVTTEDVPVSELVGRVIAKMGNGDAQSLLDQCASIFPECGYTLTTRIQRTDRLTVWFRYVLVDTVGTPVSGDEAFRRASLDAMGMYLTPRLIWDLYPYSFAFDWLYSVRSILEQFTMFKHLKAVPTVASCMISRKEITTYTLSRKAASGSRSYKPQPWEPTLDASFSLGGTAVAACSRSQYRRWILDPLDVGRKFEWPALKKFGELSWFAKLTGIELLAQRL